MGGWILGVGMGGCMSFGCGFGRVRGGEVRTHGCGVWMCTHGKYKDVSL